MSVALDTVIHLVAGGSVPVCAGAWHFWMLSKISLPPSLSLSLSLIIF